MQLGGEPEVVILLSSPVPEGPNPWSSTGEEFAVKGRKLPVGREHEIVDEVRFFDANFSENRYHWSNASLVLVCEPAGHAALSNIVPHFDA